MLEAVTQDLPGNASENEEVMNQQEEDIRLIERYLDHAMSEQERAEFQDRMKTDAGLTQMIAEMELLVEGIRYAARQELLAELKEIESSIEVEDATRVDEVPVRPLFGKVWYAAAAIALLVIAGLAYDLLQVEQESHLAMADRFIEQHFPSDYGVTRSLTEAEPNTPSTAFSLYEGGNYAAAAELFLQILEKEEKPELLFYGANSLLKAGDYSEAIALYKKVEEKYPSYQYSCESSFLIACAEIKRANEGIALEQLDKVLSCEDSTLTDNAQALKKSLQ